MSIIDWPADAIQQFRGVCDEKARLMSQRARLVEALREVVECCAEDGTVFIESDDEILVRARAMLAEVDK